MNPLSQVGRCREAIGLVFGLLILLALPWRLVMLMEPGWLLLVLLVLACMAGFAGGSIAVQQGLEPSKALRFGAWAAFLSALVAASIFALSARLMESWFYIFKAGTSGLLSLLPVTFYGMICAGVAALVLGPQETHSQSPGENTPPMPLIVWSLRGLITLLVLLAVVLPPTSPRRIALPTAPAAAR